MEYGEYKQLVHNSPSNIYCRAYYWKNREKLIAYSKKYYEENYERLLEYQRERRRKVKKAKSDRITYSREYYHKNKAHILECNRQRYQKKRTGKTVRQKKVVRKVVKVTGTVNTTMAELFN